MDGARRDCDQFRRSGSGGSGGPGHGAVGGGERGLVDAVLGDVQGDVDRRVHGCCGSLVPAFGCEVQYQP